MSETSAFSSMMSLEDQLIEDKQRKSQKSACQTIMKYICCLFESDEEISEQKKKQKKRAYNQNLRESSGRVEKNNLNLMGCLQDGNNCLTLTTQRNFFVDVLQRKPVHRNQIKSSPEAIMFSLFDYGCRLNREEINHLLPEKLSRYIAKRISSCQPQFFMDVIAWSSGPYLFLGDVPLITLIQEENEIIRNARHNAQIYQMKYNLEYIQGDSHCITHLSPDVLYVHPYCLKDESPFSIYSHIRPDIKQLLSNCLQICENIILVLPKMVQSNEIASLVSFYLRKLNIGNIKIEIQRILVDGVHQYLVVYIGTLAMLKGQDELEFIAKMLVQDRHQDNILQSTYRFLKSLCDQQSLRQILDRAIQAQTDARNKSETILQVFINKCLRDSLINKQELDNIYDNESNILYQNNTPQYKAFTPATFDPKEIEYSRNDGVFSIQYEENSPRKVFKQTMNMTNVTFRNPSGSQQNLLFRKGLGSFENQIGSINPAYSSQRANQFALQDDESAFL